MNQGYYEVSFALTRSLAHSLAHSLARSLAYSLAHSLTQGKVVAISSSASANDRLFLALNAYDDGGDSARWERDGIHLMTLSEEPEDSED